VLPCVPQALIRVFIQNFCRSLREASSLFAFQMLQTPLLHIQLHCCLINLGNVYAAPVRNLVHNADHNDDFFVIAVIFNIFSFS